MAEKKDLKIGIIGIGVLGSVVEKFFKEKGHQVYCHEGWKGLCLLKDTEALFNWAKKRGVNLSVLGAAIDYNSEKLASQGIKKDS
ncbi:hypothetical protein A2567_02250 [Candidatus Azambacteria bacterium RIFOXYD1_FULL_42_11]|uniref:Gfo/Idh/MocA-like oxidoreductase N-terminal domain-containing protein n=2 Tax=Candidatus Azamiibacteriota TaxID=1752741 RepID=A0A1F5CKA4_9BACT|nr:MAG: hypothetical protein A2567_02250 [Candidatus Azambacteria bacterium RIFOXYD1_FULL_42_11]